MMEAVHLDLSLDFLGDPVVKNLPCNAGHMGSPDQGTKFPQATERLRPCGTSRVSVHSETILHETMKIPCPATKTQCS